MGECLELLSELSEHCSRFDGRKAEVSGALNTALGKMTTAAIHALLAEQLMRCACRSAVLCGELPAGSGEVYAHELMAMEAASFAFGPLPPGLMVLENRVQGLADRVRSLIQQETARQCSP